MSPWDEQHVLRGSPLYMAPEMVCRQQYDARVDLWSVGVILYGGSPPRAPPAPQHPPRARLSPSQVGGQPHGDVQQPAGPAPSSPRLGGPLLGPGGDLRFRGCPPKRPPPHAAFLAEALFGRPPFASRSFAELEEKIRSDRAVEVTCGVARPPGRGGSGSASPPLPPPAAQPAPAVPGVPGPPATPPGEGPPAAHLLRGLLRPPLRGHGARARPRELPEGGERGWPRGGGQQWGAVGPSPEPRLPPPQTDLVVEAVKKDQEGDASAALALYCKALEYFVPALHCECPGGLRGARAGPWRGRGGAGGAETWCWGASVKGGGTWKGLELAWFGCRISPAGAWHPPARTSGTPDPFFAPR